MNNDEIMEEEGIANQYKLKVRRALDKARADEREKENTKMTRIMEANCKRYAEKERAKIIEMLDEWYFYLPNSYKNIHIVEIIQKIKEMEP